MPFTVPTHQGSRTKWFIYRLTDKNVKIKSPNLYIEKMVPFYDFLYYAGKIHGKMAIMQAILS